MKRTNSFYINKHLFQELYDKSYIANNLYNQANWLIKQQYKMYQMQKREFGATFIDSYLNYYDLDKLLKTERFRRTEFDNYSKLGGVLSQQILRLLDKNWKSYFNSLKDYRKHSNKYNGQPKEPNFKIKGEQFVLIYPNPKYDKNGLLVLSKNIRLKVPKNIKTSNINQVRVIPEYDKFKVEIIYEKEIKKEELDKDNFLSIDLGVNNFATCITNKDCFLMDGKIFKSELQYYKMKIAKINKQRMNGINNNKKKKSQKEKEQLNLFKKQRKRANFKLKQKIKNLIHQYSRFVVNYCIKNKIGKIICGKNKNWKQNCKLSKINNQSFISIPHTDFINKLKYKFEEIGGELIICEESYTSKCDFLNNEEIKKKDEYSGKRIKRGLFQSGIRKLINADVNGALNILKKYKPNFSFENKDFGRSWFRPVKLSFGRFQKNLKHRIKDNFVFQKYLQTN